MLKIGCHISSSGGFLAMGKRAAEIDAGTFQFFTRNPRGGAAKAIDPDDVKAYLEFAGQHGISQILAHAPYTLNPCAAKDNVRSFAFETMADDLRRMELIPGSMYNLHPGSHVGQGADVGIEKIAEVLNTVMWADMGTAVLLETMAGKGSEVGGRFEELAEIINHAKYPDKLGICLDTCHVYDGGYDIVSNLDGVLDEFDRVIGLERLRAIHLNDSKNPFSSHKDRHEVIGGGSIGLDAFKHIINHSALRHLPFYLETPNELPGYAAEIALLKGLYTD